MIKDKCILCGTEINSEHVRFMVRDGFLCNDCHGKELVVYLIRLKDEPRAGGYYQTDLLGLKDLLDDCESGDGYVITKHKMFAGKYFTLPEFNGF
jgi:hypothetical protein